MRLVDKDDAGFTVTGTDDPKLLSLLPEHERDAFHESVSLAEAALEPFDLRLSVRGT